MNQDLKVNERRKTSKQSQQTLGQTQIKEEAAQEVQNRDMFESTDYKAFFNTSVTEQYEDFVYLISLELKADEQPIHVAAREGKVDMIRHIFDNHRAQISVDCVMSDNWTPFFYSGVNSFLITVEVLAKEYNCNINHLDKFNRSALHQTARYNNRAMVKKLLDLGINIELKDMEELTAFELAKQHGGYDVAQFIGQNQLKLQKELERQYDKDSKKIIKIIKEDPPK